MKQSIVVPTWLGMSHGKVASQCCHVALKYGRFADRRVILRIDGFDQLVALIRAAVREKVTVGYFLDGEPTTEGTAGMATAFSFRGKEEAVNRVTGGLELY